MRVLVTGAAGGIGSRLAKRLYQNGFELLLVDDLSGGSRSNLGSLKDSLYVADLAEVDLYSLFKGKSPDVVFHLAGKSSLAECEENPSNAFRSNLLSTIFVSEYAKSVNAHLVFSSTSAVYEGLTNSTFSEDLKVNPHLAYPLSKRSAEEYLGALAMKTGYNATVFRLFNVFGEDQNTSRKQPPFANYLFREFSNNRIPTIYAPSKQSRDYVYVEDIIDLMLLVIDKGKPKNFNIYNACSGSTISVGEIVQAVASGAGIDDYQTIQGDPESYWDSFSGLTDSLYPLNKNLVRNEVHKHSIGDGSKTKRDFGWVPTTNVLEAIRHYASALNAGNKVDD